MNLSISWWKSSGITGFCDVLSWQEFCFFSCFVSFPTWNICRILFYVVKYAFYRVMLVFDWQFNDGMGCISFFRSWRKKRLCLCIKEMPSVTSIYTFSDVKQRPVQLHQFYWENVTGWLNELKSCYLKGEVNLWIKNMKIKPIEN